MTTKYDAELEIATASNRKALKWQNRKIRWSALVERLSKTTRTAESMKEYSQSGKDRQSDIKDVGGFVGGFCAHGRRVEVQNRSLLCLDADFADGDIWPDWTLAYDRAAVAYSTHKHTPEKPRLRLVIPLTRPVSPEEYPAVARRVAEQLGIEKFDDSTYQPERLMYWPSTSQDGEFFFRFADEPFLDPDEVLATYHDWRDISEWPVSSRVAEVAKKRAEKQQDPTLKKGMIGAFCRPYTITEAIGAFIPEYEPTADPNRYTYAPGSTGGGVVIYDDKFAFSHHATDPASMQLVNAWDLVRLHRFGELDRDIDPDTPSAERPSTKAMREWAKDEPRVKTQLAQDRLEKAQEDFSAEGAEDWQTKLRYTAKGGLEQSLSNAVIIIQNDPKLKNRLAMNELEHSISISADLPWREIPKKGGHWEDSDDAQLRLYLERTQGFTAREKIYDAILIEASVHMFHPIRDYLKGCEWDGTPRVDTLLVDCLGAEDTAYTRAVTRKTLTAAVARVMNPGVKFDYMLTLRGEQGIGKSELVKRLGGPWYSDTFSTVQGKEAYEQLMGVWLMEVGELAGMRRAEAETIKQFISKTTDRFRQAYGRRQQEFPRQCIFIGTTNEEQFLRDATGNRRFWVVDTAAERKTMNAWDLTPELVKQIWGEAKTYYEKHEPLFLPPDIDAEARQIQASYEEETPHLGLVKEYLDRLLPEDWDTMGLYDRRAWLETDSLGTVQRKYVCTIEIWAEALRGSPEKMDRYAVKEVREIMAKLAWERCTYERKSFPIYGQQRYYKRR